MKKNSTFIIHGDIFWSESMRNGLEPFPSEDNSQNLNAQSPVTLYQSLQERCLKSPNRICLFDDTLKSYTYHQIFELVEDFSRVLFFKYQLKPGERVGLLLYNSIEFCVALYAINKLHATSVLLPTKYKKSGIASLITKADLTGMIYDQEFAEYFQGKSNPVEGFTLSISTEASGCCLPPGHTYQPVTLPPALPSEIAVMLFTSGTTSQSKGVLISNYNAMSAVQVYQKILNITAADRTIIPIPMYHVTGLIALLTLFIHAGGCIYLHKYFDAQRILKTIQDELITFMHASPTVFSLLLKEKRETYHLRSLRMLACGSSNMPKVKILELKEWLPDAEFRTVYGLTETSSPAAIFPEDAALSQFISSVGHPIPGTCFKICDDSGMILPPGKIGTIYIKGTVVTCGYFSDKKTVPVDWLDTGDLGYFNQSGYLYIVDRKKDMINRGGEKICSIDIENLLYSIPGIRDAAVVGIPDETYGEVPAAMISLTDDTALGADKIQSILSQQIAKYQIPTKYVFVEQLPLTENAKINKKQIRELLLHINHGGVT